MRRRGAWRIGMGESNLFSIFYHVSYARSRRRRDSTPSTRQGCSLRRRRRAWTAAQANREEATTAGRGPSPTQAMRQADGPVVLGSPRPLGLPRPGRPGLPASCGAGKARRRPCASLCRQPHIAPFKLGPASTTKKTRVSRSEGSSGRVYKCMAASRGGTAHHLPVLLAKVNRPARRVAVTRAA